MLKIQRYELREQCTLGDYGEHASFIDVFLRAYQGNQEVVTRIRVRYSGNDLFFMPAFIAPDTFHSMLKIYKVSDGLFIAGGTDIIASLDPSRILSNSSPLEVPLRYGAECYLEDQSFRKALVVQSPLQTQDITRMVRDFEGAVLIAMESQGLRFSFLIPMGNGFILGSHLMPLYCSSQVLRQRRQLLLPYNSNQMTISGDRYMILPFNILTVPRAQHVSRAQQNVVLVKVRTSGFDNVITIQTAHCSFSNPQLLRIGPVAVTGISTYVRIRNILDTSTSDESLRVMPELSSCLNGCGFQEPPAAKLLHETVRDRCIMPFNQLTVLRAQHVSRAQQNVVLVKVRTSGFDNVITIQTANCSFSNPQLLRIGPVAVTGISTYVRIRYILDTSIYLSTRDESLRVMPELSSCLNGYGFLEAPEAILLHGTVREESSDVPRLHKSLSDSFLLKHFDLEKLVTKPRPTRGHFERYMKAYMVLLSIILQWASTVLEYESSDKVKLVKLLCTGCSLGIGVVLLMACLIEICDSYARNEFKNMRNFFKVLLFCEPFIGVTHISLGVLQIVRACKGTEKELPFGFGSIILLVSIISGFLKFGSTNGVVVFEDGRRFRLRGKSIFPGYVEYRLGEQEISEETTSA